MARTREKVFTIRLNEAEYENLKNEAKRRQVPMGELFRDFIKSLESDSKPSKVG